jgi:hypothetical protein
VSIHVRDAHLPAYEVALASWPGRALSPSADAFRRLAQAVRVPALLNRHARLG